MNSSYIAVAMIILLFVAGFTPITNAGKTNFFSNYHDRIDNHVKSVIERDIIYVPDNYPSIQSAVDNASSFDTIIVRPDVYYEHVTIHQSLTLIGEDRDLTIIDGSSSNTIFHITEHNVSISNFTIQNCGTLQNDAGVKIENSKYVTISQNNFIDNQQYGIYVRYSSNNTVSNNYFLGSGEDGIRLRDSINNIIENNSVTNGHTGLAIFQGAENNTIISNTIMGNSHAGIYILEEAINNQFYHNNFLNNTQHVYDNSVNIWDNGYPSGGNYWDDYNGTDNFSGPNQDQPDSDGIGDTPYNISGWYQPSESEDRYPLMNPSFLVVHADGPDTGLVNTTVQFTGSALGGVLPYNYSWDFDDGTSVSFEQNPTHIFTGVGPFEVKLTVKDNNDDLTNDTITITIIHHPFSTLWVDNDYDDVTPGWMWTHFDNIQQAVLVSGENGTINVANGTYFNQITIDNTIHLQGENRYKTIIDAQGIGSAILINVDYASVSGFTLINNQWAWNKGGVELYADNVTIENNYIDSEFNGIFMKNANFNTIKNNTLFDKIHLESDCNNNIFQANNGTFVIGINHDSQYNTIIGNTNRGVYLYEADYNSIENNNFTDYGIAVLTENCYVTNNTVNNKPIIYYEDINNLIISEEVGQVIIVRCDNITIQNMNIVNTISGIQLVQSQNCIITENSLSGHLWRAVSLIESYNNTIMENTFTSNTGDGIALDYSDYNKIYSNDFTFNSDYAAGIFLYVAQNNDIFNNNFSNNFFAIFFEFMRYNTISNNEINDNEYGLYGTFAQENTIENNNLNNNIHYGIYNENNNANTIINNTICNSNNGIWLESNDNIIYHNTLVDNDLSAASLGNNIWYSEILQDGNYWSDYTGMDNNSDGIGDTPYILPFGIGYDLYPLMEPHFWDPICGDADGSGELDIDDVVYLIQYIFSSGPEPVPYVCVGDCNGSGDVDIDDVVYLINYIFAGGPAPVDDCCD